MIVLEIIMIVLTTIIIIVLNLQRKDSIKRHRMINRPRLIFGGIDSSGEINHYSVYLKNIGNIPAENIHVSGAGTFYHNQECDISSEIIIEDILELSLLMPGHKHEFLFHTLIKKTYHIHAYSFFIVILYLFENEMKTSVFRLDWNKRTSFPRITGEESD